MTTFRNPLGRVLGVAALLFASTTGAQVGEIEPNEPCDQAQLIGLLPGIPATVTGSLDTPPDVPDVDFYRFTGAAGDRLRVNLQGQSSGLGTLGDPYLGLFDGACNLLAINDDFQGLDSRLDFFVPPDGTYVLAAGSCCDPSFQGFGGSSGSYTLRISEPPPPISAISGVIVNSVTGDPVPGDRPPYAFAYLARCDGGYCDFTIAGTNAGPDGRFRFETDFAGAPIEPGDFQVLAFADRYESAVSGPFSAGPGEAVDVGELALAPPLVSLGTVRPCDNLPSEGGLCRYSVSVKNNSAGPLSLRGWSNVNAGSTGSSVGSTVFPARRARKLEDIPSQSSATLHFNFYVRPDVADGAYFCTDVWISRNPDSYYDTVDSAYLFCVSKISGRLVIESEKAVRGRIGPRTIR